MFKRKNKIFLIDILDSINAIFDYIKNMDFDTFKNDRKTYSAVLREFIVIGEAISKKMMILNQHILKLNGK